MRAITAVGAVKGELSVFPNRRLLTGSFRGVSFFFLDIGLEIGCTASGDSEDAGVRNRFYCTTTDQCRCRDACAFAMEG